MPSASAHDAAFEAHYRDLPVLVTGGAGFIGSHLVDALVKLGARVRVIDDLTNGREENLAAHGGASGADSRQPSAVSGSSPPASGETRGGVRFIKASILDEAALRSAIDGCAVVFHQAALGSVPASVEQPLLYHEVNGTGTLRVLEAARRAGVKRVIYASSSSVYGESATLPKVETMLPTPVSPYAASKLMGEYWLQVYAHCYGLSGVSLRYFNVFGPRQRPDSPYAAVVPAFAAALRAGRRPIIYGDGLQSRDFTHVNNVVHANLLAGAGGAVRRQSSAVSGSSGGERGGEHGGTAINIACGERYTLLELLEVMQQALGTSIAPEHRPERAGDVRHSQADITLARHALGYETITGFREGLRAMLDVNLK